MFIYITGKSWVVGLLIYDYGGKPDGLFNLCFCGLFIAGSLCCLDSLLFSSLLFIVLFIVGKIGFLAANTEWIPWKRLWVSLYLCGWMSWKSVCNNYDLLLLYVSEMGAFHIWIIINMVIFWQICFVKLTGWYVTSLKESVTCKRTGLMGRTEAIVS